MSDVAVRVPVAGDGSRGIDPDAAPRAAAVVETARELRSRLEAARRAGRTVGLVPTMGALHAGHRSLVERAAAECDVVVVTVFVNPTQFDDPADLAAYPRTLDVDVAMAAAAGAQVVFAPAVSELYPRHPEPSTTIVHVDGLADRLEGASRPGHFDGVATVVTKLLVLAGPCRAYFGQKDAQQLAVVRRLVEELLLPVEVVGCPVVREPDGLALSSRNVRLDAEARDRATCLHRALLAGAERIAAGERSPTEVGRAMVAAMEGVPTVAVDYARAVDPATFEEPDRLGGTVQLVVAARVGAVRLLDTMAVDTDASTTGTLSDPTTDGATDPAADPTTESATDGTTVPTTVLTTNGATDPAADPTTEPSRT